MKYSTAYIVALVVFGTALAVPLCVARAQVDQAIYCHSGQYCSFDNPDTSEGLFRQNPSDGYIWFIPYPTLYTPPTTPPTPSATTTPITSPTTTQQQPTPPPTTPTQNPPSTTNPTKPTEPQPPTTTPGQTLAVGNNLYYTVLFYLPGNLGTSTGASIPLLLSTFFPNLAPADGFAVNPSAQGVESELVPAGTPLPGDKAYLGDSAEAAYEYYTDEESVEVVTMGTPGTPAATTTQKRKVLRRRLVAPKKQHGLFDDPLVLGALGITIVALGGAVGYAGYKRYYVFDDEDEIARDGSRDTFS